MTSCRYTRGGRRHRRKTRKHKKRHRRRRSSRHRRSRRRRRHTRRRRGGGYLGSNATKGTMQMGGTTYAKADYNVITGGSCGKKHRRRKRGGLTSKKPFHIR